MGINSGYPYGCISVFLYSETKSILAFYHGFTCCMYESQVTHAFGASMIYHVFTWTFNNFSHEFTSWLFRSLLFFLFLFFLHGTDSQAREHSFGIRASQRTQKPVAGAGWSVGRVVPWLSLQLASLRNCIGSSVQLELDLSKRCHSFWLSLGEWEAASAGLGFTPNPNFSTM